MKGIALSLLASLQAPASAPSEPAAKPANDVPSAIVDGVRLLVNVQEEDGAWPYQGVYGGRTTEGEYIPPLGYRVGGTAICALALLYGTDRGDGAAWKAIGRGVDFILETLDDPDMGAEFKGTYDVRIWGHAYALLLFCRLGAEKAPNETAKAVASRIPWLVAAIEKTEIPGGGWNYARRQGAEKPGAASTFTTAPVVQALLEARALGFKVDDSVLARGRKVLEEARMPDGAFVYAGGAGGGPAKDVRAKIPGAIARMPACETTLRLLGGGSEKATRESVEAFFEHWGELEARRQKTGTHEGPYRIAPYYFYYGHYYAAQAIETLPDRDRPALRKRLHEIIFRTREPDGSWNDRVFERSKNFGTAMVVLAFLAPKLPAPAALGTGSTKGR